MSQMHYDRYEPTLIPFLHDRRWPGKHITEAPIWCSVDLRDGNQALMDPMDGPTKLRFFEELVRIGFKEIEVGFPAASQTDFDFVRTLIEDHRIPDDVTIQVLTQARPELITRTFEAVQNAKRAIVHLYNPTSTLQRRVVFGHDFADTFNLAVSAAQMIKALAGEKPETDWVFQYSPESFTGTEVDFAARLCDAIAAAWDASPHKKVIINLPATVELFTPNVYADMIEYMCRNMTRRKSMIVSLHTHNDRGTGIAATEFGLMAGADRVEGTLFGNGERTGNLDVMIVALNMMQQGVDPKLDVSDMTRIKRVAEDCTGMRVHERHPYAGSLAFTAFSGGHQDAVRKGLQAQKKLNSPRWAVPYLHIDPRDIGRDFKGLIRINSQSGKGGIGHVMEDNFNICLRREHLIDFSGIVQEHTDRTRKEAKPEELLSIFENEYIRSGPLSLVEYIDAPMAGGRQITATVMLCGEEKNIVGKGNGPVNAFTNALNELFQSDIAVDELHQDSLGSGSDATAISHVPVHMPKQPPVWGVGRHTDTTRASFLAIVSAVNRSGLLSR